MAANKSVEKTLRILELIAKCPEGITLAEIYKQLKLPKATVFDILQALYKEDAIYYKDQSLKTYVIGSKIFTIGQAYTKNSNFINFASMGLRDFANKYELTVFAAKRLGEKVIYIYKYESPKTKIITNDIGVQIPLHLNAAGRAFLAFLDETKSNNLLAEIREKAFDGEDDPEYQRLLADIKRYRELGYVIDDGETEGYIRHYALPVYNFENKVTGVICASGLMNGYNKDEIVDQIKEFKEVAEYVSSKQGYKKPRL
ncbi:MAG: IclR family transcriptional regulator [Acholeplasmataceae bacterium]|nr:IclR family transcriptional regulator [Acholeplasmataceae bacterium]